MDATYFDGVVSRGRSTAARLDDGFLIFEADGETHRWALAEVEEEALGDRVRLVQPDGGAGRLIVPAADWRAATAHLSERRSRPRRRAVKLVVGLTMAGVAFGVLTFVVAPLAAGPLARRTPPDLEVSMGRNFRAQVALALPDCQGQAGQAALQDLGARLNRVADTPFQIRVRAVQAPIVNAFALPGGEVMVTDELIAMAETPDELAAVIAHEAAHVEKRHVMQAVWRALGLGLILDAVVGGGSGAGQQAVLLAGSVSSLRYSREAEAEADTRGQALLSAAGLSSRGMAPFFRRLAAEGEGPNAARVAELLSSHPDSHRRADDSAKRARDGDPAFDPAAWAAIKAACKGGDPRLRRFGVKG